MSAKTTGELTITDPTCGFDRGGRVVDVLVVDDDPDIRQSASAVLRTAGFRVAEAGDGLTALRLLGSYRFGLILLDVKMPPPDGVAVVEGAMALPPVVVHSASSLSFEDRRRLGSKVVKCLVKPVEPATLLAVVAQALDTGDSSTSNGREDDVSSELRDGYLRKSRDGH